MPALVEVNLSGEESKSGVAPEELGRMLELYSDVRGLMTMPPLAADPEASRPYFRRLRELAEEHGLARALDGHEPGLPRRRRGGRHATSAWARSVGRGRLCRQETPAAGVTFSWMGLADVWNRTLVYFGIAEEDDEWDDDGYATEEELERNYRDRPERAPPLAAPAQRLRRLDGGGASRAPSGRTDAAPGPPAQRRPGRHGRRPCASTSSCRAASTTRSRSRTSSRTAIPVILNLQASDAELSKRLIDFASGLTYALDGGMQRVADKVFLLTPRNVEVSAEERARMLERGGFFNQA